MLPPGAVMSGFRVSSGVTPQEEKSLISPEVGFSTLPETAETVSFRSPSARATRYLPSAWEMAALGRS